MYCAGDRRGKKGELILSTILSLVIRAIDQINRVYVSTRSMFRKPNVSNSLVGLACRLISSRMKIIQLPLPICISVSQKMDELEDRKNNVYRIFSIDSVHIIRNYYVFNFPLYILAYICIRAPKMGWSQRTSPIL